jgi:hypothetical protein
LYVFDCIYAQEEIKMKQLKSSKINENEKEGGELSDSRQKKISAYTVATVMV